MDAIPPGLLAALTLFAFVSSITPGPNNTMLLASGANFGVRRTVPHMMGVWIGFSVLIVSCGLGLGALFAAYPPLHAALKVFGGAYLLWLAWKVATAGGLGGGAAGARPMTFLEAAAFQWINPKAWTMGLGAVATYVPQGRFAAGLAAVALVFAVVNLPCIAFWAALGTAARRLLDRPRALKAFNWTMAVLLVVSLYPLAEETWRWASGLRPS